MIWKNTVVILDKSKTKAIQKQFIIRNLIIFSETLELKIHIFMKFPIY